MLTIACYDTYVTMKPGTGEPPFEGAGDHEVTPPAPVKSPEASPSPEAEPEKTKLLNRVVDYIRNAGEVGKAALIAGGKISAGAIVGTGEVIGATVGTTAKGLGVIAKAVPEINNRIRVSNNERATKIAGARTNRVQAETGLSEAKTKLSNAEIERKRSEARNKVAGDLAQLEAEIEKMELAKRALAASATVRNKKIAGANWIVQDLKDVGAFINRHKKKIIVGVGIAVLLALGDGSLIAGFENLTGVELGDTSDMLIDDTTGVENTPDVDGVEGIDGKTPMPGPEKTLAGLEPVTPTETDFFMPDSVAEYTIGTGDGITHGILELKETLEASGGRMPDWLNQINTPGEAAEWAQKNHFYTPDFPQDSVMMHKGEVLGIDTQGNLSIRYLNGEIQTLTNEFGNAAPDALSGRVFTDSLPSSALSIPAEISADTLTHVYANAEHFGNASVSYFAGENPYLSGTSGHRAWEDIVTFLGTRGDTSWQTNNMPLIEYLKEFGGAR